jgi:hypothetical protein
MRPLLTFAFLLAACRHAPTLVTDVYRDPSASRIEFRRVAAIALVQDPAVRRAAEDEMVRHLGTKGVASYTVVRAEDERGAEAVRARLQSEGIDGAVTMRLLSLGEEPLDPRGEVGDSYKAFTGYYGAGPRGAAEWESVARVETEIFSLTANRLLWSGATKTFSPSDAKQIVSDVARTVAAELRKSGLIE